MDEGKTTIKDRLRGLSMRTILAIVIIAVMAVSLVAFVLVDRTIQQQRAQEQLAEEARVFASEMDSVWNFMEIARMSMDDAEDNYFVTNRFFCAVVGKSVAALFTNKTEYTIRYTAFNPRNILDKPDDYESEALSAFYSTGTREYYGVASFDGEQAFRYIRALDVEESCLDCHGEPAGETDPTGYPKEGWTLDAVGGAISIVIPADSYTQIVRGNLTSDTLFVVLALVVFAVIVYLVLTRFVFKPLDTMKEDFSRLEQGSYTPGPPAGYETKEIQELTERFDGMAQTLQSLYADLETRVADRTKELEIANGKLEELNDQLKDEIQYKSDFLSMVSHELRTPLTSILVFAQMLKEKAENTANDKDRTAWTEIEKNCHVLLEMINNMLDIARLDTNRTVVNREYLDLGDVLPQVRSIATPLAEQGHITFTMAIAPDVPLVYGDTEKIAHMLENLVNNAIKFTPEGGRVNVDVRHDSAGNRVLIAVSDTGIGIAPEDRERIFERFVQLNSGTTRKYGGTGLGLSLVREYARLQGFSLSVDSEVGKGSTFTIGIPLDGAQEVAEEDDEDRNAD